MSQTHAFVEKAYFKELEEVSRRKNNLFKLISINVESVYYIMVSSISRPGGTPGWLWNLRPESTELDHLNLSEWLGPVQPLHFLSRSRPAPTTGPAVHALHGPSCKPVTPRTTSTSGPRASPLRKTLIRPLARESSSRTVASAHGASAAFKHFILLSKFHLVQIPTPISLTQPS